LTIREGFVSIPLAFGFAEPTFLALKASDLAGKEGILDAPPFI
jgi:hypothetical protein